LPKDARKSLQTKEKQRIIRSKIEQRKATMSIDENIKNESEIGSSPLSRTKMNKEKGHPPENGRTCAA
jgi:hypothetical protein